MSNPTVSLSTNRFSLDEQAWIRISGAWAGTEVAEPRNRGSAAPGTVILFEVAAIGL
jgi:hypothetical protein